MRVAIVGSRGYVSTIEMFKSLDALRAKLDITHIITGGARGVDTLAEKYGRERGIEVTIIKPEWDKYGKAAGFVRNEEIMNNSEVAVIFWDGISRGTEHALAYAKAQRVLIYLFRIKIDKKTPIRRTFTPDRRHE